MIRVPEDSVSHNDNIKKSYTVKHARTEIISVQIVKIAFNKLKSGREFIERLHKS